MSRPQSMRSELKHEVRTTSRTDAVQTTAPAGELSDVTASWLSEAEVLRRRHQTVPAAILKQCAEDIAAVSEDFTTWLSESEAARRSGWSVAVIRRHARKFLHTPHVVLTRRSFRLRACIVPRRVHQEMLHQSTQLGAA